MHSKKYIYPFSLDEKKPIEPCGKVKPFTIDPWIIEPFTLEEKPTKMYTSDNELPKYPLTDRNKKENDEFNKENGEETKRTHGNGVKKGNRRQAKSIESAFISNYRLTPIAKHVFINHKGEEIPKKECIRTEVKINGDLPRELDIKTADIRNIAKIIGDRFSMAILSEDSKAEKFVENAFRRDTRLIPTIRFFVQAGWQRIDGKRIYASDTCVETKNIKFQTGLSLPVSTSVNICEVFQRALRLYADKAVMATMFLYAFTGVMYKVFEEAGYPPRFLLFLNQC